MTSNQSPSPVRPSIAGRMASSTTHRGSQASTTSRPSGRRPSRPSMSLAPSQIAALQRLKSTSSTGNGEKGSVSSEHRESAATSTTKSLMAFREKVLDPDLEAAELQKKRSASESHRAERQSYREILEQVKRAMDHDKLPLRDRLWAFFSGHRDMAYKDEQKLLDMARHFFPPRGQLKAYVCDIGPQHSERFETTVGEIEYCACLLARDWDCH